MKPGRTILYTFFRNMEKFEQKSLTLFVPDPVTERSSVYGTRRGFWELDPVTERSQPFGIDGDFGTEVTKKKKYQQENQDYRSVTYR